MTPLTRTALLVAACALFTAACGEAPTVDEGPQPLSEPGCVALADALAHGDDWRAGLEPLDPAPRPSVAKPGFTIRLWVSADALETYRALAVDAEVPAASADFPRGASVVREIFDAEGNRTGVTATCRAQAGYNPDVGDLWFASRPGDADSLEVGRIASCNSCHTLNDETAGLYGPLMPAE